MDVSVNRLRAILDGILLLAYYELKSTIKSNIVCTENHINDLSCITMYNKTFSSIYFTNKIIAIYKYYFTTTCTLQADIFMEYWISNIFV